MKHYFSTLFVLVLLTNQIFAQKTLSPSIRPYAANWTYSLVKAMNRAGFDMPTKAAPATNGVASRSPLQLDSTKTYNAYDQPAPGDSTPLFRTTYQYASANEKTETDYQWENNAWLTLSRTTLISDGQQRILSALAEAYDPNTQDYKPDSKIESYPHGNSQDLIDSFFIYGWDTVAQDWLLLLGTHNTYDTQDRLLESVSNFDYFGTQVLFKDVYLYDANGDNHLIEQSAVFDGFETPSGRTELVYTDHRPIEETAFTSDGINFYPANRINYAYTLFGALRLHMSFIWDESIEDFRMTQRIEYEFDNAQRVASRKTTHISPNAWDEIDLVTYAYVEDENLALEMTFNWDDDLFDWVLDSKEYYYYNGVSSVPSGPGSARRLAAWPNPTTGFVQLSFDSEADVRVFDVAGQLLQSRRVQPGHVLDFTGLPAGIYSVTAQQGIDFYSGKIVKQ
jgi:hypothetical protein